MAEGNLNLYRCTGTGTVLDDEKKPTRSRREHIFVSFLSRTSVYTVYSASSLIGNLLVPNACTTRRKA